jgi:hypothetical protein
VFLSSPSLSYFLNDQSPLSLDHRVKTVAFFELDSLMRVTCLYVIAPGQSELHALINRQIEYLSLKAHCRLFRPYKACTFGRE